MKQALQIASIAFLAVFMAGVGTARAPSAVLTPALERALTVAGSDGLVRAWVFFEDKGVALGAHLTAVEANLTDRSRARRERSRPGRAVDHYDVPVVERYVNAVSSTGAQLRHTSRWFNAVSVTADRSALQRIEALPFVSKIDVVRRHVAALPDVGPSIRGVTSRPLSGPSNAPAALDYGPSLTQNVQINVPAMHNLGIDGSGVVIAVLDAGFNTLEHESLQHLIIIDTWDFVNGDANVDDELGQMGSGSHGHLVLSAMAGFAPGNLIGPAYGATFLLYKTENTIWERHIEEDDWVAGAERADSMGADIISSSLGYLDGFTNGETGYTWMDMDGNTTIATIGADIAASRGILVLTSAGNSGAALPGENTLIGPADGDSVIAVGAVDATGVRAAFSSMGPSFDGRTKPDIVAMGQSTVCASTASPTTYTTASGTSLSCPLAAGAAALVLQAQPTLSNMELRDRLRTSANNAASPDNETGWGIINAHSAAFPTTSSARPAAVPANAELFPPVPNPFNPSTMLTYRLTAPAHVRLTVHDAQGKRVFTLFNGPQTEGTHREAWNGMNSRNQPVASGVYFFRLTTGVTTAAKRAVLLK